jgi:murein endopeptidase
MRGMSLTTLIVAGALLLGSASENPSPRAREPRAHDIEWRNSVAVGEPEAGSLVRGVMLPGEGRTWVSWDPVERDKPNRWWRRWGTDRLVRTTLSIARDYSAEHPRAPRVLIGDMSRPHGGDFGTRFGPIGHASHQNGLDVDVYYPRVDRREWTPRLPEQVDVDLAQELVDRFVAAGAEVVYVGPSLPLTGPPGVVVPLVNHDNHLHARLPGH